MLRAVIATACLAVAIPANAQTQSPVANAFIDLCVDGRGAVGHVTDRATSQGWRKLPDGLIPNLGLPFTSKQAWVNSSAANPVTVIAGVFDMPANNAAIHMTTCVVVSQPAISASPISPDPHVAFSEWLEMAPDPRFTNSEQTAFGFTTEGQERRSLQGLSDLAVTQAVANGRVTVITLMGRGTDRIMIYVAPSL
ncbi:hypothetical protein GCM10017620_19630 [Brevundimonas intermedia]|uniref:Uncharacterized protein n=1 Tax=Brevundimonas intermedia TaxID=74315 RepID=A0ABQ5TA39_9CAUL|nr:hypothetical protein [Brevundimonas intermedia]GLK48990.1 hypothetical protein GCM10017620_19630 [Brevundimonas intermedia]